MSVLVKPDLLTREPRVYCQSRAAASLLSGETAFWVAADLPASFPKNQAEPFVVVGERPSIFTSELGEAILNNNARLLYVLGEGSKTPAEADAIPVFSFLSAPLREAVVSSAVRAALENLRLARSRSKMEQDLQSARVEVDELNEIGIAVSTQRDTESLLKLILQHCRRMTNSDAGSLYLTEQSEDGGKRLRFKLTQNDSISAPFAEFTIPIDSSSIAGYVAFTGETLHLEDAYEIPDSLPFRFNPAFDKESGYRTKSMLVVPIKNPQNETIGVVQLINCKCDPAQTLDRSTVNETVVPYPESRRLLVTSLANQAAVAIENSRLYESIQALFEGFVKASVVAIEARDPTTSGHSFRVADLTVALAEAVDRSDNPAFRDIQFSLSEMREIRYASLLHDFGKVGVREEVLVKAKKLYPLHSELIKLRFDFVRKTIQQEATQRKLDYVLQKGREEFLASQAAFDEELAERLQQMDEYLEFILRCNEPTVLPGGNFQKLGGLASMEYQNWEGQTRPLLTNDEISLLSIPKGSLDERERLQIESHVVHTFNFLSQIPWTKEIKNIPAIARAHHEKLNGMGYPYQLNDLEIPFQSKMMTVSDIYDALSASDRPYKKAVPTERALDILRMEANQSLIDSTLVRLFVEAEVYKKTAGWKHPLA